MTDSDESQAIVNATMANDIQLVNNIIQWWMTYNGDCKAMIDDRQLWTSDNGKYQTLVKWHTMVNEIMENDRLCWMTDNDECQTMVNNGQWCMTDNCQWDNREWQTTVNVR